jgi:6-phosphogluconolactonase (cycloisomerase 2 family)
LSVKDSQGRVEGFGDARAVALSQDDKFVYVASNDDDAVTVLIRNPTTGGLARVE